MSVYDEIDKAISAHGMWKQKLRKAIDTGECESTPERVKQDNNCSFGKWLHERISQDVKDMPQYTEIVQLHADFHREAGEILALALTGSSQEARQRIELGSKFAKVSALLTKKMKEWQTSL